MQEYDSKGALDHKARRLVFNFILSNPGASVQAIKRFLDMNESTLKYHLHYLEKNEKIYSKHEGRRRCYFCKHRRVSELYHGQAAATTGRLSKTQTKLLDLVRARPGITQKELSRLTKLDRKSVSYNLKRLSELRLVWVVKKDGTPGYEYITKEKLREEMLSELVNKLLADEIDEQTFRKIRKKLESMDVKKLMR